MANTRQNGSSGRIRPTLGAIALGLVTLLTLPPNVTPATAAEPARSETRGSRLRLASDSRLASPLVVSMKARPLEEVLREISRQVSVPLDAGTAAADDKVSLFASEKPAGEMLDQLASRLGYVWSRRRTGYRLHPDLSWRRAEVETEQRLRDAAALQLPGLIRLYEEQMEQDAETLERLRNEAEHALRTETDPERRLRLRQLRRVTADLLEPGVRMFMQVYRQMTPEDRAALAAGRAVPMQVAARGADGEPIEFEVQVRQGVEGNRARLTFRAPESVSAEEDSREPNIIEWRLETLSAAPSGRAPGARPLAAGITDRRQPPLRDPKSPEPETSGGSEATTRRITIVVGAEPAQTAEAEGPAPARPAAAPVVVERRGPGHAEVRWHAPVRPTVADFAEAVAIASGMPVIADAYTRPVSLRGESREPLARVLERFCERNDTQWSLEGGYLVLRSATAARDRRQEVPERLLRRWADRRTLPCLPLETVVDIAASLNDDQLRTFEERWPLYTKLPESYYSVSGGLSPWSSRAGLRFYASLTGAQRQTAAAAGLPFARMLPRQRELFAAVFADAAPAGPGAAASPEEIASGAFRVTVSQHRAGDGSVQITTRYAFGFHVGSQEAPRITFRYSP